MIIKNICKKNLIKIYTYQSILMNSQNGDWNSIDINDFLRGYTHRYILSIPKHQYILIIWKHMCIKCAIIYIVFKFYGGHVINIHRFLKYNNNTNALKNLKSSVNLIRQTHRGIIFNICTIMYKLTSTDMDIKYKCTGFAYNKMGIRGIITIITWCACFICMHWGSNVMTNRRLFILCTH